MPKGRFWTKEEDEYILEKAGKVKPQTIADKLDKGRGCKADKPIPLRYVKKRYGKRFKESRERHRAEDINPKNERHITKEKNHNHVDTGRNGYVVRI